MPRGEKEHLRLPEACVFHDGTAFYEWEPFAQIPFDDGNYVGYVFDYLGKTYMTGSYRNPIGTGLVTFMRYNGSNWEYVPGGIVLFDQREPNRKHTSMGGGLPP
ncbi:MAG: hypothetical protein IPL52_06415 [Flavobacteriales bacterium]|nr:hypothetical protein [Flavobacteriales bacterium]